MDAVDVQVAVDAALAAAAITAADQVDAAIAAAAITAADQLAAAAITAAAQQQTAIDAAVAAAIAATQPGFSLSPGVANPNVPWNYHTSAGIKLYYNAISALTVKFKGDERSLRVFLSGLTSKAKQLGWESSILSIPDSEGVVRSLLRHYSLLTLADVNTHALTYINGQTRASQASGQLAECIKASLDEVLLVKLLTRVKDYTVQGTESGPCMLKSVISIVTIETRSAVPLIKKTLGNLSNLMQEVKSDITEFNLRVSDLMNQLRAADEDYPELLDKLFEVYQTVSDKTFVAYIAEKQSRWEDNELAMVADQLKALADDKFKTMSMKSTWNAETKEEKEIIALKATISQMSEYVAMKASLGNIRKDMATKGGGGSKERSQDGQKWAWKEIAPTDDQAKEKTFENKVYIYCPHHRKTRWVLKDNHAGGCNLAPDYKASESPAKSSEPTKKALQYAKALMSVMETAEGDEPSDEYL
jgi:hypothetical protein